MYPVKFCYLVSGKILPDIYRIIQVHCVFNSFFEIGETCVKTLEQELESCLTGLMSGTFICRLPDLFQFYLNQWKHIQYTVYILIELQMYL